MRNLQQVQLFHVILQTTLDPANLSWFPKVSAPKVSYDLTPYTSTLISETLRKKSPCSAPGDDEILYGYLAKMPGTHKALATIFTGIRDSSHAPRTWERQ